MSVVDKPETAEASPRASAVSLTLQKHVAGASP
jgi:hypothetical protein